MKLALAGLLVMAACGGGGTATPDASAQATVDAAAPRPSVVYLAVDGVTLTAGSDDAIANTSSLGSGTVVPYANTADHATAVAALLAEVQGVLAPYNLVVTTTRPTSGAYRMIVVTDSDTSALGIPAPLGANIALGCTPKLTGVGLVFPVHLANLHSTARVVIAEIGILAGMPTSNATGDCMCYVGSQCGAIDATCTIGGANTPNGDSPCVAPNSTMNEQNEWLTRYGAHHP